ncbi:MAG: GNAT family N-acetyltransferase [Planctomycetota bacterium]
METSEPGVLETDAVLIRELRPEDLGRVVRIDAQQGGRPRSEYYQRKLEEALAATPRVSLAAELDGAVVGFLLGRLYYGEFGLPEPTAVIDSIGVDPAFEKRHVGAALMRQLVGNLRSLGIESIRTEVEWDARDLVAFLARQGFRPAPRLCLELRLAAPHSRRTP